MYKQMYLSIYLSIYLATVYMGNKTTYNTFLLSSTDRSLIKDHQITC